MLSINPKHLFKIVALCVLLSGVCFFQVDGDYNEGIWILLGSMFAAIGIWLGYKVYQNSKNK